MYRPLEPHVRVFALSTLAALFRYDLRCNQVRRVIALEIDTLLRSDVIVDGLARAMGVELDTSRAKVVEIYLNGLRTLINIADDKFELCGYPALLEAVRGIIGSEVYLDQVHGHREAVFLAVAEQALAEIETAALKELQGTLTVRTKQRLLNGLITDKPSRIACAPERIPGPNLATNPDQRADLELGQEDRDMVALAAANLIGGNTVDPIANDWPNPPTSREVEDEAPF